MIVNWYSKTRGCETSGGGRFQKVPEAYGKVKCGGGRESESPLPITTRTTTSLFIRTFPPKF